MALEPQKRIWIYGGLAHPPSVALVHPRARRRLPGGSTLLVAGDEHAWGLAPFLKRLGDDSKVATVMDVQAQGAELRAWTKSGRLGTVAGRTKPTIILLSLPFAGSFEADLAELRRQAGGVTLVWVRPPGRDPSTSALRRALDREKIPSFHSESLPIPRAGDAVTARGYAGWAGALWRWIG